MCMYMGGAGCHRLHRLLSLKCFTYFRERESAAAKMEKFLKGHCKAPTECHPSLNTFPESQCLDVESKMEHVVRACEMENRVFKLYATGKNKPRSVSRHHSRRNHVTAFCR